jgi:hypothetical protein
MEAGLHGRRDGLRVSGSGLVNGSAAPALPRKRRMWTRLVAVLVPALALVGLLAYGFRTNPREIPSPLLG